MSGLLLRNITCNRRYRQQRLKCRSELYAMKHSSLHGGAGIATGHCDGEPPLISPANVGYGVASTAGAIDDLAMTSLPLRLSPTCRHFDSPYRTVTWSRPHHVIDDIRSDLLDVDGGGHYGTALTHGSAHALCARRHRPVRYLLSGSLLMHN